MVKTKVDLPFSQMLKVFEFEIHSRRPEHDVGCFHEIQDLLCQANERFSNGDPIGGTLAIIRTINAFLETVHDIVGAFTGVFELTSALHSAIGGAADCTESHLHEFLKDECGPQGYTCWIARMFSDLGSIFKKNTTVVVTHDKELLHRFRPRVAMLHEGKVFFDGAYDDFEKSDSSIIRPYFETMQALQQRVR